MTEAEWLTCKSPDLMISFVQSTASVRKLRLFGVACCRRIWELMPDVKCELAVDIAECHAEGHCDDEALHAATQRVASAISTLALVSESAEYAAQAAQFVSSRDAVTRTAEAAAVALGVHKANRGDWDADWAFEARIENRHQASLLREFFGNPFRTVSVEAAWRTSDVMALTRGIYEERAFERMPILADALQDAGCESDDILSHLRDPQATHVRGCWALDLVLGKE